MDQEQVRACLASASVVLTAHCKVSLPLCGASHYHPTVRFVWKLHARLGSIRHLSHMGRDIFSHRYALAQPLALD